MRFLYVEAQQLPAVVRDSHERCVHGVVRKSCTLHDLMLELPLFVSVLLAPDRIVRETAYTRSVPSLLHSAAPHVYHSAALPNPK